MTTSLASCSAPADSAIFPGLSMRPDEGVATDAGFADVLEFCATPAASSDVSIDRLVAAVMPPATSARSWRLDSVETEPALSDHDDEHVQVPAEILALAVNAPPILVQADLQADSARSAGYTSAESSPRDATGNDVTNLPLRHQAVSDAPSVPDAPAPEAIVDPAEPTEKFAAAIRAPLERVNPVAGGLPNNKFLNADPQSDARPVKVHGTGRAKSPADMHATPDPIPAQTAFVSSRAGVMSADTIPFIAPTSASVAVTSSPASPASTAEIAERREVVLPVTDATVVVRELAELTHEFRFRERGSVEVKFNFKDATELSVRLAYRDGDVHATFRTDSDDLRAALGREWQDFAANNVREPGSPRIADPVFTGANDLTDSSLGRDSGSAAGGDARDRWQASHPDQAGSARSVSPAREFRPHAPALGLRVSSDRLLHAFA